MLTVPPYSYRPGKGVPICDGASIVATVLGTSYPTGSACEEDHKLARVMAAAPELLAALIRLEAVREAGEEVGALEQARAAIAKAEGRAA